MGRLLAIDYGERRIGLALSDEMQRVALGLRTLEGNVNNSEFRALREIVSAEGVEAIILGIPIGMSGRESYQATITRRWGARLAEAVGCPVIPFDERLTSVQAHRELDAMGVRRKQHGKQVDTMAATLLLQSYLEFQRMRADQLPVQADQSEHSQSGSQSVEEQ